MTGSQIISKFEELIDDTLDATLELQLANDAMHDIETEIRPEIIKKVSTSGATVQGQTYTTAETLPADFFLPTEDGVIYVGTTPYTPVPFSRYLEYKDAANRYWIDLANTRYYLSGTQGAANTITFPYIYDTTDITTSTSPVWPSRFHSLIPFKMAEMFFAIDGGDKSRSWDDKFAQFYSNMLKGFRDWDAALKLNAINRQAYTEGASDEVDIGRL